MLGGSGTYRPGAAGKARSALLTHQMRAGWQAPVWPVASDPYLYGEPGACGKG